MTVKIVADGLARQAAYLRSAPQLFAQASALALNDVAKGSGLKLLATNVQAQVDFPSGYINKDRLYVSKYATAGGLEVTITARQRPTSLARFAAESLGSQQRGQGVHVHVKTTGSGKFMPGAFLVRLKAGASLTEDNYNVGLAVRLKKGTTLNKREFSSVQLSHNLYLLYGPSINQVFSEVASESTDAVLDLVETEFLRQFVRLSE